MMHWPLTLVSPAGPRGRLSILIYHRVQPEADPLCLDVPGAAEFEARMRWVAGWFNVLPLREGIRRLYDGTIPARALAITFDDGYADNEEVAAPILRRLGLSATFFITTGYLGGGCMWNDRVIEAVRAARGDALDLSALGLGTLPLHDAATRRGAISTILTGIKHLEQPRREAAAAAVVAAAGAGPTPRLMMTPDQVRSLRVMGMDIGGHTITHPILATLASDAARDEIARGKAELEAIVGAPVPLFAYPNGQPNRDYRAEHGRMARDCGYEAAVTTAWGAASQSSDRFQLPRFTPWDSTRWRFGLRMLLNTRQSVAPAA